LGATEGIVDWWSAATGDHEADASVVEANEEGHDLFRVTIALMIYRTKAKTTDRTSKVQDQWPSWGIVNENTFFRNY